MAERRMFSMTIVDSDAFLDMPLSTQAFYFHLSMRADDEGFINNPRKIQRVVGCSEDDYKLLIGKRFIIPFDSGIVVIKHWKIHNYIRKDRLKETLHQEEKACLTTKSNGSYTVNLEECQPNVNQVSDACQHRLGKDRLGKDRLGKDSIDKKEGLDVPNQKSKPKNKEPIIYDTDEKLNQTILDFIDFRKKIRATMTDRAITLMLNKLNKMTDSNSEKILILEQSIMNGWKSVYPLKEDSKDKASSNKFNDFEQRNYSKEDFDDLEKKLLNKGR